MIKQVWAQLGYIFSTFPLNKLTHLEALSHLSPGDPSSQDLLFYNQTSLTPADCSTRSLLHKSCETLVPL